MKFVPPLVPPFVDGTSKVWHAGAPVRRRVIFCGRGWYNYFLTIKFMRLRKPIVRSLGFEGCSDVRAPRFIWGLSLNPYWNSWSKSSRSCAVISDTFLPTIEILSACFSSSVIQITPHPQNRIVRNPAQQWIVCWRCHSGAIQSEEALGYYTTIGADGWPVGQRNPAAF